MTTPTIKGKPLQQLQAEALQRAYDILQHETSFEVKESKMDVFVLDLITQTREATYRECAEKALRVKVAKGSEDFLAHSIAQALEDKANSLSKK